MRERIVGDRTPAAPRLTDDNPGIRPYKGECGGIIDGSRDVASSLDAGTQVVIPGPVVNALYPGSAGRAIAAPQGHYDDEAAVEKPTCGFRFASTRHSVAVVGECAVGNDDETRGHVAQRPADACLQQMMVIGGVGHRNPMDLRLPSALGAAHRSWRRLGLCQTGQRKSHDEGRRNDR